MNTVKKSILGESISAGYVKLSQKEKYPSYSENQMKLADWRLNEKNLSAYQDSTWECANCHISTQLFRSEIMLAGTKNRFIVTCYYCSKPSIIQMNGKAASGLRIITEARSPYSMVEKEIAQEKRDVKAA